MLKLRRSMGRPRTPEAAILHASLIIDSYISCSITLGGGGGSGGGGAHPAETTLRLLSSGVRSARPSCEMWASRLPPPFGPDSRLRPEAAGSLPGEEVPAREGVLRVVDKVLIKKKRTAIVSFFKKTKQKNCLTESLPRHQLRSNMERTTEHFMMWVFSPAAVCN